MALKVGDGAPDFTLKSHTGQMTTLSGFHGKPVLLLPIPFAFTGT